MEYSPYQTIEIAHWKQCISNHTLILKQLFNKIINGIKDGSLIADGNNRTIHQIEFFHGVDTYEFRLNLFDEKENDIPHQFGDDIIFNLDCSSVPLIYNFEYPEELDIYLEEERNGQKLLELNEMFFSWFALNWMECGGHLIGISTFTHENSINNKFDLIRFSWNTHQQKNSIYPFLRKLTEYEIRKRVGYSDFPGHHTHWRYFEKGQEFFEFGSNSQRTYFRKGHQNEFETQSFELWENNSKSLLDEYDELIRTGYFESIRPSLSPHVLPEILDWKFATVIQEKNIKNEQVDGIENAIGKSVPYAYRLFLTTIYRPRFEHQYSHFSIQKENWISIKKYFTPIEIIQRISMSENQYLDLFPIAETQSGNCLFLNPENESVHLKINNRFDLINPSFVNFLDSCIQVSPYFIPIKYHIEKNNATAIEQWIAKGGDVAQIPRIEQSLSAVTFSYETLEVLLRNGIDPQIIPVYYWDRIPRKSLDVLIKYGYDLKGVLSKSAYAVNTLKDRGGFEDLLIEF